MSTDPSSSTVERLLKDAPRPHPPSAWSATITHFWRGMKAFQHFPVQLIDIVLMPMIFLLMFTYVFGGAFAGNTHSYLQYFLPGILVQSVLLMTVYTGTSLNTDITKGVFDRFRSLPFWQPATLAGSLLGDIIRYVISLTATMLVGYLMGYRGDGGVIGALATMVLLIVFGFAISWIFAAIGIVVSQPERVSGTSMIALYPLMFTSNIFVDPKSMPDWMQVVVNLNPLSHAATASRSLMSGNPDASAIGWTVACCAVLVAIFAPLSVHLYKNKNAH